MDTSILDGLKSLGLATVDTSATQNKQSLGQEEFLKLLTTQLTHQDPMKPMENGEFLGQMAQFSTVSGIQDLQASFKDFAGSISSDQALQAASLVGRYVSAPSQEALLSAGGSVAGDFELPASSNDVNVKIIDPQTGEVIKSIGLGTQAAGKVEFEWDGVDQNGQLSSPGVYKIEATAQIDGANTQLATNVKSLVQSVTMGTNNTGLQVNLAGVGTVKFNQLKQIL